MAKYLKLALVCLIVSGMLSGCDRATQMVGGSFIGKPFPELKLVTYDDERFDLRQLKGQVVILKLWATWCGICREEAPLFLEFTKGLDESVVVVSVSVDSDLNLAREYLLEYPDNFLHVFDQAMVQTKSILRVNIIPQVYIIDRTGVLRYQSAGMGKWDDAMLQKIQKIQMLL